MCIWLLSLLCCMCAIYVMCTNDNVLYVRVTYFFIACMRAPCIITPEKKCVCMQTECARARCVYYNNKKGIIYLCTYGYCPHFAHLPHCTARYQLCREPTHPRYSLPHTRYSLPHSFAPDMCSCLSPICARVLAPSKFKVASKNENKKKRARGGQANCVTHGVLEQELTYFTTILLKLK